MNESVVTIKGQTTLPKSVRKMLGIGPGDRIRYFIGEDSVRIVRARSIMELEGHLHRPGAPAKTLSEMEQGIARGATGTAD